MGFASPARLGAARGDRRGRSDRAFIDADAHIARGVPGCGGGVGREIRGGRPRGSTAGGGEAPGRRRGEPGPDDSRPSDRGRSGRASPRGETARCAEVDRRPAAPGPGDDRRSHSPEARVSKRGDPTSRPAKSSRASILAGFRRLHGAARRLAAAKGDAGALADFEEACQVAVSEGATAIANHGNTEARGP